MTRQLPLEILGFISPILSWVERGGGQQGGLPEDWKDNPNQFRERGWLHREMQNASLDNLADVIRVSRQDSDPPREDLAHFPRPKLNPPANYLLAKALHKLANHYFVWAGNELCIREGRLTELHELARRFPVPHLIRYHYAQGIRKGYMTVDGSLARPMRPARLPSNYHGIRVSLEKGLYENHLHLSGLLGPEEVWIDNLLCGGFYQGLVSGEHRLTFLGRILISLLASCLLLQTHRSPRAQETMAHLNQLTHFFDALYTERNPANFKVLSIEFKQQLKSFHKILMGLYDECCCRGDGKKCTCTGNGDENCCMTKERGVQQCSQKPRDINCCHTKKQVEQKIWDTFDHEARWLLALIHPDEDRVLAIDMGLRTQRNHQDWEQLAKRFHLQLQVQLLDNYEEHRSLIETRPRHHHFKTVDRQPEHREEPRPLAQLLENLAFRYLIIHTHHWQQATQKGRTTGLAWFNESRTTGHRRVAARSKEALGIALEYDCKTWGHRNLEGRISPPRNLEDLHDWLLRLYIQQEKYDLDAFGLVIHFKKTLRGRRSRPPTTPRMRYGFIRRTRLDEALRLYRLMSKYHHFIPYIVGIDAASEELASPPEVFAPIFRFLREFPIELRTENIMADTLHPNQVAKHRTRRLGMTYHVGEEFRHLLSGLRAIDEVITFLNPHPGDRLGHAIALGLSPETWMEQCGHQAVLSKQEYLDTLVWVHHLMGTGHPLLVELEIEDQIQGLSRELYDGAELGSERHSCDGHKQDWPIPTLYDAWKLRQLDPLCLDTDALFQYRLKFIATPNWSHEYTRWLEIQRVVYLQLLDTIGSQMAYGLLGLYTYSEKTYARGSGYITVDLSARREAWLALMKEVQARVCKKVLDYQITIEACPSSNLMIGPFPTMEDHPIFNLTLDENNNLKNHIRVTVNTDNPGILVTSLEHEYYQLAEILIKRGMPESKVIHWINWLRQNGEDSSFLKAAPSPCFLGEYFDKKGINTEQQTSKDGKENWELWAENYDKAGIRAKPIGPYRPRSRYGHKERQDDESQKTGNG